MPASARPGAGHGHREQQRRHGHQEQRNAVHARGTRRCSSGPNQACLLVNWNPAWALPVLNATTMPQGQDQLDSRPRARARVRPTLADGSAWAGRLRPGPPPAGRKMMTSRMGKRHVQAPGPEGQVGQDHDEARPRCRGRSCGCSRSAALRNTRPDGPRTLATPLTTPSTTLVSITKASPLAIARSGPETVAATNRRSTRPAAGSSVRAWGGTPSARS